MHGRAVMLLTLAHLLLRGWHGGGGGERHVFLYAAALHSIPQYTHNNSDSSLSGCSYQERGASSMGFSVQEICTKVLSLALHLGLRQPKDSLAGTGINFRTKLLDGQVVNDLYLPDIILACMI